MYFVIILFIFTINMLNEIIELYSFARKTSLNNCDFLGDDNILQV